MGKTLGWKDGWFASLQIWLGFDIQESTWLKWMENRNNYPDIWFGYPKIFTLPTTFYHTRFCLKYQYILGTQL